MVEKGAKPVTAGRDCVSTFGYLVEEGPQRSNYCKCETIGYFWGDLRTTPAMRVVIKADVLNQNMIFS